MINRTKVKESTQIKPGDNGDVLVMKDNAPEWSTPSDADLAKASETDTKLAEKQDKLTAGDNIKIEDNVISAAPKPTPINIGTVTEGDTAMVSNSGTDTDVVLNFVLPKGEKGDPGEDGTQVNNISPLIVSTAPYANRPDYNLAIGNKAQASTGLSQLSVGANAICSGVRSPDGFNSVGYSIAVGGGAAATGAFTAAVGYNAKANSNGSNAEGSSAFGCGAITFPDTRGGTAVGANALVSKDFGTAIGLGASAGNYYGVAIGRDSHTTRDYEVSVGKASGVSRPDTPFTRLVSNVTDPTEPQDAATKNYVDTEIAKIPTGTEVNNIAPLTVETAPATSSDNSIAIGNGAVSESTPNTSQGIVIGTNSVCGVNGGVVIGHNSKCDNSNGVVIGNYVYGKSGVHIGTFAQVRPTRMPNVTDAIGAYAEVPSTTGSTDNYAVALGSYSVAGEGAVVSVGSGVTTLTLSDDMTEEQKAIARASAEVPTRRIVNVTDPLNAQDAATKNYVDTQLTPINAKLQYVPENTNQILSQIETNAEKAQSAAEAAQTTAESKANQSDLTALQTTVTQQAETIAQLQTTITQLQSQLNNLTLEVEEI